MKKVFLVIIAFSAILTSCNSAQKVSKSENSLEGSWQLNYVTGPRIAFKGLYPDAVPFVNFDLKENKFSGSNSCNSFNGNFTLDKNKISFKDDKTAMTMMACQGEGEQVFMSTLQKIDSYLISDDGKTLDFLMGDVSMMRFEKMVPTNLPAK